MQSSRLATFLKRFAVVVAMLFAFFPIYWLLTTSIKPVEEWASWPPVWFTENPTLQNYRIVFFPEAARSFAAQEGGSLDYKVSGSAWKAFQDSTIISTLATFLSVAAGGWALPDGPLVLFSAAAAYCLARATIGDRPTPSREPSGSLAVGSRGWWIGFGVSAGLALLSKYHGLLLLAGTGFYLVTSRRRATWLRRRDPYIALALAAMTFLPVLVWNATHEWASFRFQGGRAVPLEETGGTTLLDSVAGQAAWTLPWVWVPLLVVLVAALRAGPRDDRRWLLACLASGPILAFTLLAAVGARGLPHWEAPGYFMALPLLGAWVAHEGLARLWARRWLWGCAVGFLLVVLGLVTQARTGWLRSAAPGGFARGDPTDDLLDWTLVAQQLRAWGFPRQGSLIAAGRWEDAAKMSYAMGPGVEVTCVGDDPRGFAFTRIPVANLGRDIVLVVRRRAGREPLAAYAAYFDALEFLGNVPIERGGREEITVSVYLGHRLRGPLPLLQRR